MTKRNKYITLTIICIFSIILLQALNHPIPTPLEKGINIVPDIKTLLDSPFTPIVILFFFFYLLLTVIGLANLSIFAVRKLSNKPPINIYENPANLPLSEEKSSKLLLLVSSFVLIVYVIEISISNLVMPPAKISVINLAIFLNLTLEITIIVTVLKFIKWHVLIPNTKIHLGKLLRIYTAMLPLILAAALISNFFLEKIGVQPSISPILEIILLLKNKLSLSLILFQVIAAGPIAEEIFFRGFLYKLLRTRYSFSISAVLISIIFALIHGSPQDTLPLFVISMVICYTYEKTQNILSPIILHSIHNTLNIATLMLLKNLM